jgi:hypothetical protein
MPRATIHDGGAAWTRAATVARARGGNRANMWVLMGALPVVRKCLDNLSVQLWSPVNSIRVIHNWNLEYTQRYTASALLSAMGEFDELHLLPNCGRNN